MWWSISLQETCVCAQTTKPLNKALQGDYYKMLTIEDVLQLLSKAKAFTSVDAKDAFWHVALEQLLDNIWNTFWQVRWLRMPYGIAPAPEMWQRKLHQCSPDLKTCFALSMT